MTCRHKWHQTDYIALFKIISLIEIIKGSDKIDLSIDPSRMSLRLYRCGKCNKGKVVIRGIAQESIEA